MVLLFALSMPFPVNAMELKTAAQESAPKYYTIERNKMAGICIDIMNAIESFDPEINFSGYEDFLPFKRLQMYLENGEIDVFFGFKKTTKREERYNFLDVPLYQVNYVIATLVDDNTNIHDFEDIRSLGSKGRILTVSGSAASRFLQRQGGLLIDDSARSPSTLLKKLAGGRGRLAFYHDLGLRTMIERENLEHKIKILPTSFSKYHHYAAFSKNIPPGTVSKVGRAIKGLINNGELARIKRKYKLKE